MTLVPDDARAQYLDSESAEGKELAKWVQQQPEGIHRETLGLLHYLMAAAARDGRPALAKDLAMASVAVSKSQLQNNLLMGALWSPEQRREFEEQLADAIMSVLKRELPDRWETVMEDIADRLSEIHARATNRAKAEAPKRITLR